MPEIEPRAYPDEGPLAIPSTASKAAPKKENTNALLTPFRLGPFKLAHRVVLAPLTRCRAIDTVPVAASAEYYAQRASGGLLISEGTPISVQGHGYPHTPGIHTEEQVEAWKPIVKAVKATNTTFFMQIWHVGRASHVDFQPNGARPQSSTNNPIRTGKVATTKGYYSYADSPPPQAMTVAEIKEVVGQFRQGALNAVKAGFDGVEIHGAHGYLLEQFLKDGINDRTDEYGGSIERRCRFPLEVLRAVAEAVGPHRTGIRLSPFTEFNDAFESNPYGLMEYLLAEINKLGILYIHVVEPRMDASLNTQEVDEAKKSLKPFRKAFAGAFIAAGGYDRALGIEAIEADRADLIAYGRLYISNPDLPRRFALNAPLHKYNRNTFYTQDPVVGYTDYPVIAEETNETDAEAVAAKI